MIFLNLKMKYMFLHKRLAKLRSKMGLSNQEEIETLLELRVKAYTELGSKNERLKLSMI